MEPTDIRKTILSGAELTLLMMRVCANNGEADRVALLGASLAKLAEAYLSFPES